MTIFFYKGFTRNPEIGITPVWVLPNIWRLGRVMDTKFGTNVSNRMLLNAAKFQGYSFYRFWVIKGKSTRGVKLPKIRNKFISWSNFMEGYHNLSPNIWDKIFTDWFSKCSDGYIHSLHLVWIYPFSAPFKPCNSQNV